MDVPRAEIGMCFDRTFPPALVLDVARRLDRSGAHPLWVIEDCFFTAGVSLAAAALAVTERLRVGLGILPAVARNPAITAMEIATLDGLGPGRVLPGIGPRRAAVDGADGRPDALAADHARGGRHRGQAPAGRRAGDDAGPPRPAAGRAARPAARPGATGPRRRAGPAVAGAGRSRRRRRRARRARQPRPTSAGRWRRRGTPTASTSPPS